MKVTGFLNEVVTYKGVVIRRGFVEGELIEGMVFVEAKGRRIGIAAAKFSGVEVALSKDAKPAKAKKPETEAALLE